METTQVKYNPEPDSVRWQTLLRSFETKMRWFEEVSDQASSSAVQEEELLRQVMLSIMGNFGCFSSALFHVNPQTGSIQSTQHYAVGEMTLQTLTEILRGQSDLTARREFVFALEEANEGEALRAFLPFSFHLILHVPIDRSDHALIFLGKRMNGQPMSAQDISLLRAMISHLTITLQHHRLVDQSLQLRAEVFRTRGLLEQFVAPEIVDEMLSKDHQISTQGERKILTILSADIRGFTAICEQHEPEMVVASLNAFYGAMSTIIFQNNGLVDKFMGDAVMAVFGTPIAAEDTVQRAIRSAIHMHEQFELLKTSHPEFNRVFAPTGIGIGIATGRVIVGNIGSGRRMDYTAVGREVNLSARLCSMARTGEIILDGYSAQSAKNSFEIIPLKPVSLKGIGEFVEVFKVEY